MQFATSSHKIIYISLFGCLKKLVFALTARVLKEDAVLYHYISYNPAACFTLF